MDPDAGEEGEAHCGDIRLYGGGLLSLLYTFIFERVIRFFSGVKGAREQPAVLRSMDDRSWASRIRLAQLKVNDTWCREDQKDRRTG